MTPPASIEELTLLARGGMAELHLGKMTGVAGVETLVVVKRILPELAARTDFIEMFISEARVAATLAHPNIVQTYRVGEDEDGYFIAMEYLQGADLRRVLKTLHSESRGFPPEFAVQVMVGVLGGLHYAHTKTGTSGELMSIVHRDVSPHNAFVTFDGAVKLLDFGVAKATSNLNMDEDIVQGKLRYMAPEQCLNAPIDPRTDVYSAGVMLYEMLTGRRAHLGTGRAEIQSNLLDHPVTSPADLGISVPDELERIVMRAVRKKRGERFQSAREFQAALEDFCQANGWFPSPARLGDWARELLPTPQKVTANRTSSITVQSGVDSTLKSTPHADLRMMGGVTVVHLRGRLNEGFDGVAIGEQLDGPTVLDLNGIERITSFGIRAWLDMLRTSRARPLYLARIPDTFVNQVSMVRGLLGKGTVVSFYLPFVCPTDRQAFTDLAEGEAGRKFLDHNDLRTVKCPLDSSHTPEFDEDFDLYDVFADVYEAAPPANIANVLSQLDADRELPPIEKEFDDTTTTFRVRRDLDESVRWRRLLDGLEGDVVFDFSEMMRFTDEGIDQLARALPIQAPDLRSVDLKATPPELWSALHRNPELRLLLSLQSLVTEASCQVASCTDHRVVRRVEVHPPTNLGEAFVVPTCRSCAARMEAAALTELPGFTEPAAPVRVVAQRRGCLGMVARLFGRG